MWLLILGHAGQIKPSRVDWVCVDGSASSSGFRGCPVGVSLWGLGWRKGYCQGHGHLIMVQRLHKAKVNCVSIFHVSDAVIPPDPSRIAVSDVFPLVSQDLIKWCPFLWCPQDSPKWCLFLGVLKVLLSDRRLLVALDLFQCPPNPSSTTRPLWRCPFPGATGISVQCDLLYPIHWALFLLLLGATHSVPHSSMTISVQSMIKALRSFRGLLSSVIYLEKCPIVWVFWNYNVFFFLFFL